jgi:transposase
MAVISLAWTGRRTLEASVAQPHGVRHYRRAQALRWLADGERPAAVARRRRVPRDTVYAWARRYKAGRPQTVATRLVAAARPGRPRQLAQLVEGAVTSVMETDPREQGYRAAQWTIPWLRQYLREWRGLVVSASTVRRCLRHLGYRWKRPRDVLARRSRYWRQAKGGSSAG